MTPNIHLTGYLGQNWYDIPLFNNDKFKVDSAENLRWGTKELALQTNPYIDGDSIQNIRGISRDIEFTIKPIDDIGDFSSIFDDFARFLGKPVTLEWKNRTTPSGTAEVKITGLMTECEAPLTENDTKITFTIHCKDPYWEGAAENLKNVSSVTIKGSAPPRVSIVEVASATIPTVGYFKVGGWFFKAQTTDLTGKVVIMPPSSITVGGVSHIETIDNGMAAKDVPDEVICRSLISGSLVNYNFDFLYYPRYY